MNKSILLCLMIILVVAGSIPVQAQMRSGYSYPDSYNSNSLFVLLGYIDGPHFDEFVDWANNYYRETIGTTDSIADFKGGFGASLGLRVRFSRHFAFEVDFVTATKKTKQGFRGLSGGFPVIVPQELELNVVAISTSVPIIFQFSDRQPVVPFVAAGISVFPIRLDHRIDFWERHTKTALAGNFAAGLEAKIMPKTWATLRGDLTYGKANMTVAHPYGQPDHFEMNFKTTQIQAGIMYLFR